MSLRRSLPCGHERSGEALWQDATAVRNTRINVGELWRGAIELDLRSGKLRGGNDGLGEVRG